MKKALIRASDEGLFVCTNAILYPPGDGPPMMMPLLMTMVALAGFFIAILTLDAGEPAKNLPHGADVCKQRCARASCPRAAAVRGQAWCSLPARYSCLFR